MARAKFLFLLDFQLLLVLQAVMKILVPLRLVMQVKDV